MKKAIIILSKVFPTTHHRKGEPTGFIYKMKSGQKIHTIRSNYSLWKKRAEQINIRQMYLSIREWTGRPYYSQQREIFIINKIGLQRVTIYSFIDEPHPVVWIDGKEIPIQEVARHDGLSVKDFEEFFLKKTNVFEGVCIHFTNFRY